MKKATLLILACVALSLAGCSTINLPKGKVTTFGGMKSFDQLKYTTQPDGTISLDATGYKGNQSEDFQKGLELVQQGLALLMKTASGAP